MPTILWLLLFATLLALHSSSFASSSNRVALRQLIEEHYGVSIHPWMGEGSALLQAVLQRSCKVFHESFLDVDRMNEVGIVLEQIMGDCLRAEGVECERPKTRSGRGQAAGYPDLTFMWKGQRYYLEIKTFSSDTLDSSQRTFYFSVSDDPKVTESGFHLLVGFEMDKQDDTDYRILAYHLVDLRELPCKVKVEYNASNRDLYGNPQLGFQIHEPVVSE